MQGAGQGVAEQAGAEQAGTEQAGMEQAHGQFREGASPAQGTGGLGRASLPTSHPSAPLANPLQV